MPIPPDPSPGRRRLDPRRLVRRLRAAAPETLPERLDLLSFWLVLLTFVASILLASAPLPLGGPNVLLAGAAILVLPIRILAKGYVRIHRSFALFLLCGFLMTVWAAWVHASTGTLEYTRIARIGMGVGIAAATYAAVTAGNVGLLLRAIVLSVLASAAFGLTVLRWTDALEPVWKAMTTLEEMHTWPVIHHRRLAGIANSVDTFGSHLAMAVPIAIGMWARAVSRSPIETGRVAAPTLLLLFLAAAVWITDIRALALAALLGGAAILIVMARHWPREKKLDLALQAFLAVSCLYVASVPFVQRDDDAGGRPPAAGPMPQAQASAEPAGPASAPQRAMPAWRICKESLGTLFPPVSVSGEWNEDCIPIHRQYHHERYARYYSFVMERRAFLAIRAATDTECCRLLLLLGRPSTTDADIPQLEGGKIDSGGGLIRAEVTPGEYTVAVVTHDPAGSISLEIEIGLDEKGSWFSSSAFALDRDASVQHRQRMFGVAYRYALDHPLGSGSFFPAGRHLDRDMSPLLRQEFLTKELHNHLLVVLSHYGLPGLIVTVLFFGCLFRSAWQSVRLAGRLRNAHALYLSGTAAGILTTCFVYILFVPTGPFYRSWHYFLAFGLVFGVQRILADWRQEAPPAPSRPGASPEARTREE